MSCWPAEGTKVTASFSLVPPSTAKNTFEAEQMLIQKEEAQEEFDYLHKLLLEVILRFSIRTSQM